MVSFLKIYKYCQVSIYLRSIIHTKSSGIRLNIFAFSLPERLSTLTFSSWNICKHFCFLYIFIGIHMFVNIHDAWMRNVRVFGSSLHLIHFNDMWRRARATLKFQTVGISWGREQIPGRQFALFPL